MTLEAIIEFCENLPGSTAQIKIEDHLTYNVGGKAFIWFGQENVPVSCSFKCSDDDFVLLSERQGFQPAPYMAHHKWIMCSDISLMTEWDTRTYISRSYELILSKLSKKFKDSLSRQ